MAENEQEIQDSGEDTEALKKDLQQLRSDMADLVSAWENEGGQKLGELRDRVEAKGQEAGHKIAEGAHSAKAAAEHHPFYMALVALGLGLIAGAIIRGGHQ